MAEDTLNPVCLIHGKPWSEHELGRCFTALRTQDCYHDSEGQKWDLCSEECAREAGL